MEPSPMGKVEREKPHVLIRPGSVRGRQPKTMDEERKCQVVRGQQKSLVALRQ